MALSNSEIERELKRINLDLDQVRLDTRSLRDRTNYLAGGAAGAGIAAAAVVKPHHIVGEKHFGTGSALDVIGFTAIDALGVLSPSAAPGAVAAILKSTASGGLTLETITVNGNIVVTGTVDGTDISTHVADVNAHHNRSHAITSGSDHTAGAYKVFYTGLAGAITELALGAAGTYLRSAGASSAPTFSAISAADLPAHDITGAKHTITAAQYDLVGATALDTLGLIASSENPGANVRVLRSTSAGGLTLETITTTGDATIGGNAVMASGKHARANLFAQIVKNTSGATANAGDVGYVDANGEYKTTTTALDNRSRPAAVVFGGTNNSDIYITYGPGRMTVNYVGSAPSTGDFLVYSTTAGKVQSQTTMHFAILARARANGSGGTVEVNLLLQERSFILTSTNDVYSTVIATAGNRAGNSDFVSTIQALPGGALVRYNTPSSGQENSLIPDTTSVLAKLTLHNTTRGDSALISTSDNTGGAGYDGEITLTATVPGTWQVGDAITIRSQTNTSTMQNGYFVDLQVFDTTTIPELARAIEVELTILDTGGTGLSTRVHPFEANVNSKRKGCQSIVVGLNHQNTLNAVVPLINRKFCAVWNASGSNTAIFALKLNKVFVAA